MKKALILLIVIFVLAAHSYANILQKEITAEGMAPGTTFESKEIATNRALRKAVEEGVGVIIDSETIVDNYQVLDDEIYSTVKGYVTGYEVISDNGGEGGLYKVKIKATVALGALTKDVKALGIIKKKLNYPRVVVLVNDYVDGLVQPKHIASSELEKIFMENDIVVIDMGQMDLVKDRDATLSYNDPQKAAALGRRYGAEVAIVGNSTSELIESSKPYGVNVYAYQATVEVKAIKTDTAEVMLIDSATETERGSGRIPTANKALQAASKASAKEVIKRLAEVWRDEVYNETSIEVICGNLTSNDAGILEKAISNIDGVKAVSQKSLVNGVAEISVQFFGTSDLLNKKLSGIKELKVKVVSKTLNRIDIEIMQ
jgi:hypothetical protein